MDDLTLQQYIDEVWRVYDGDKNGTLDINELHWFLNDLCARVGDSRRYSANEVTSIFKEADVNKDSRIDKTELFRFCKFLFNKKPLTVTSTVYIAPTKTYTYTYYSERKTNTKLYY